MRRSTLLVTALALAACSAPGAGPTSSPVTSDASGFSATIVLTRQRDLVDRGLVNVFTRNGTGGDVTVLRRALTATSFVGSGPVDRTSRLPAGRQVALQLPYGDVADCTDDGPVQATLVIDYTVGADPAVRTAEIAVSDASVLDDIRATVCTRRTVAAATTVALSGATLDDEVVTATLTIDRHQGGRHLVVTSLGGTVLFGVHTRQQEALPLDLGTTPTTATIAIDVVVNRCDPHALAETTKKYAVDLRVSVDGAPPRAVALDVDSLVPLLDEALERCRERTGA